MPRRAVCLLLLTATFSSCSGPSEEAKETARPVDDNPCSLVTRAEVEKAVGMSMAEGTRAAAGSSQVVGEQACQFASADTAKPLLVRVGSQPPSSRLPSFAQAAFDKYVEGHPDARPTSGIGIQAVWDEATKQLLVRQDGNLLSAVVFGVGVDRPEQRARILAAAALARLKGDDG